MKRRRLILRLAGVVIDSATLFAEVFPASGLLAALGYRPNLAATV